MESIREEKTWSRREAAHPTFTDPLFEAPEQEENAVTKNQTDREYILYHPDLSFTPHAPCIQGTFADGFLVTLVSDKTAMQHIKDEAQRAKRTYIIISKEKQNSSSHNFQLSDLSKRTPERIDLTELYASPMQAKEIGAQVDKIQNGITSTQSQTNISSEFSNEQVLEFIIADIHFAIPLMKTREIVTRPDIIPQPDARPHIRGTVVHRTRAIPVIDMRSLFDMPEKNLGRMRERLIVIHDNANHAYSILVDTVLAVTRVEKHEINDPVREHLSTSFSYGSVIRKNETEKYTIHILDIERIIQHVF